MRTILSRDELLEFPITTPTVVRMAFCKNHDYITLAGECSCSQPKQVRFKFAVVGTTYGYLHSSSGGMRLWNSASGARHAKNQYVSLTTQEN